jgi:ABC-type phosphate transport system substrate-binding protein
MEFVPPLALSDSIPLPLSEIEMYQPMTISKPPTQRDGSVTNMRVSRPLVWCWFITLAMLAPLGHGPSAVAAQQMVPLFADRDLGDALVQAAQNIGPEAQQIAIRASASAAACTAAPIGLPRLALLARSLTRSELDRCLQSASAGVSIVAIGRQAVAVVVPINSPVWPVDAAVLFHAVGRNGGDAPPAITWNGINPTYPNLPIGLLLPPPTSRTRYLFDTLIMQPGCDQAASMRTPFDLMSRASFCAGLRSDIQVSERKTGVEGVANWAAAALPGQIAVVSVGELRQLDRRVVPLLLDGALPTAANIESGRYPAAAKIELMIVMPNAATQLQRADARGLVLNLLCEASIGPTGGLAPAGLIPLPPSERIATRSQAVDFLEQR